MNIWSLKKDVYLKHLLLVLTERFGTEVFALTERWAGDVQALGIVRADMPGVSAYVYTYGQTAGRFGVELEYPDPWDSVTLGVAKQKEDISLDDLVEILRGHLELDT